MTLVILIMRQNLMLTSSALKQKARKEMMMLKVQEKVVPMKISILINKKVTLLKSTIVIQTTQVQKMNLALAVIRRKKKNRKKRKKINQNPLKLFQKNHVKDALRKRKTKINQNVLQLLLCYG